MDNIEMFRKLSEIFSTGNTSEVGMLFDSLYLDHQKPDWLSVDGPDEFTQIVLSARKSLPNLKVEALEPVVADENVVVGRMSWKSDNTERETIEMLRLENGKFVEHWGAQAWSKQVK